MPPIKNLKRKKNKFDIKVPTLFFELKYLKFFVKNATLEGGRVK